ncbi:MAG: hypothetical protein KAI39_10520 [Desulfobulbaceae bacterium]|nr:hypothetical protein [Desulfobulbaceae bacterium]
MRKQLFSFLAGIALILPLPALAAEKKDGQALDQAANDPTASLMSIQIQNIYSGEYHKLSDESVNTILLRSAIPFQTGNLKHIARATLPIVTDNPSGESGLGDLTIFDLLAFDKPWGRWGAGLVGMLPTAADEKLGSEKWAVGPALGFVARNQKLMWGLFNQNLFSFAGDDDRDDVNVSTLQPIINYSLPDKWSIGVSEMTVTYDWEKSTWTNLPLGLKVSKLVKISSLPVMFSGSYEYNFQDDYVSPEWTVNFTLKFLFPI